MTVTHCGASDDSRVADAVHGNITCYSKLVPLDISFMWSVLSWEHERPTCLSGQTATTATLDNINLTKVGQMAFGTGCVHVLVLNLIPGVIRSAKAFL